MGRQAEATEVALGSVLGWGEAWAQIALLGYLAGPEALHLAWGPPGQANPLCGLVGLSWLL